MSKMRSYRSNIDVDDFTIKHRLLNCLLAYANHGYTLDGFEIKVAVVRSIAKLALQCPTFALMFHPALNFVLWVPILAICVS